jgi:hypothetical protein
MSAYEVVGLLVVAWLLGWGVGIKVKAVRQMVDAA